MLLEKYSALEQRQAQNHIIEGIPFQLLIGYTRRTSYRLEITCLFSYRGFSCTGSNIGDADLKLNIGDADIAKIA
jgi:hypothetical protein